MRVLIDTNVFIERERDQVVPEALQELEKQLRTEGHTILVHRLSKEEIRNYKNDERRERAESKIATYAELKLPKYPSSSDDGFRDVIGEANSFNERVDNALLYAVYSNQVDLLVTEDKGIHSKGEELSIGNKVFDIQEGRDYFQEEPPLVNGPPSIKKITLREIDVDDPIFDSLKDQYDFENWVEGHPNRDTWVNWNPDGSIGAILIIKPKEVEVIGDAPPLSKRERLKICTLKVAEGRRGSKIGELLISIAIQETVNYEIEELYLTHYIQPKDYLVDLISNYGFWKASEKADGEAIFLKRVTPGPSDNPDSIETHVRFYPSFYDGKSVDKFLIPVKPIFHSRLFTSYDKRQPKLKEFEGQFFSEGNAIKKAYLSRSNTRQIEAQDLLLFYRTEDHKSITSIGVCEQVEYGVTDPEMIHEFVGKRSVFSPHEIVEYAEAPTTIILFTWHFDLSTPIHYQELLKEDVISGPIQTIQQVEHECYKYIRRAGGIDERFTIN